MIAVYAQSRERQGIDAAIDGLAVVADDAPFIGIRQKSMGANLKREAAREGGVVVHQGAGIVRIQLDQDTTDDESRVIVVITSRSLRDSSAGLVPMIEETAKAIGRRLEPSDLEEALALAAHAVENTRRGRIRTVVLSVGILFLALGAAAALRRASR